MTPEPTRSSKHPNLSHAEAPQQQANYGLPDAQIFQDYGRHLAEKVEKQEMGRDTASNYARTLRRYLNWIETSASPSIKGETSDPAILLADQEKAGDLLYQYLETSRSQGRTLSAINGDRSILFQFHNWALTVGLSKFDPTDAGYLAPQLAGTKMPYVVIKWGEDLRGSPLKNANQIALCFRPYVNFVAAMTLPPDGQSMDLKGEWRALKNIQARTVRNDKEDAAPRKSNPVTVTGRLLLVSEHWISQYLNSLVLIGVSPDEMKRQVFAIRTFYRWAKEKNLTELDLEKINNPYVTAEEKRVSEGKAAAKKASEDARAARKKAAKSSELTGAVIATNQPESAPETKVDDSPRESKKKASRSRQPSNRRRPSTTGSSREEAHGGDTSEPTISEKSSADITISVQEPEVPNLAAATLPLTEPAHSFAPTVLHPEAKRLESFNQATTLLLKKTELSLSELRNLTARDLILTKHALKSGEKTIPLSEIETQFYDALATIHGLDVSVTFQERDASLLSANLPGVFREETISLSDKNAAAFISLRDQIAKGLIREANISFRGVCTIPLQSIRGIGGEYSLYVSKTDVRPLGATLSRQVGHYLQFGRISLPGNPFSSSNNQVHFMLTVDGESLSERLGIW